MSDTKNVKLGPCRIFYGGVDLGYTQGGVEVMVTTDTHEVNVDQFGKTVINETIQGRNVMAKVPMAETTLENLVKIMPGAKLVASGAVQASATITFTAQPAEGSTITIGGVAFKFTANPAQDSDVLIGASFNATAANLQGVLSSFDDTSIESFTYAVNGGMVTMTAVRYGTSQNGVTLATNATGVAVSPATSGGVSGIVRVDVPTAVGVSLLDIALPLVLHPRELPATDQSFDFVIPRASTPGAINFTYKTDTERTFPVQFKGYPDPATDRLFFVGPGN